MEKALGVGFMQRVLFVILAIAAALLVFKLLGLWLLIFGAIVIATVLRALDRGVVRLVSRKSGTHDSAHDIMATKTR